MKLTYFLSCSITPSSRHSILVVPTLLVLNAVTVKLMSGPKYLLQPALPDMESYESIEIVIGNSDSIGWSCAVLFCDVVSFEVLAGVRNEISIAFQLVLMSGNDELESAMEVAIVEA